MLQKHVVLFGKDIGIWPWKSMFNYNFEHIPHIITHRCMVRWGRVRIYIYIHPQTYELIKSNQLIRKIIICISIILIIWVIYIKKCCNFFWVAQLLLFHLTNQKSTNFTSKKNPWSKWICSTWFDQNDYLVGLDFFTFVRFFD